MRVFSGHNTGELNASANIQVPSRQYSSQVTSQAKTQVSTHLTTHLTTQARTRAKLIALVIALCCVTLMLVAQKSFAQEPVRIAMFGDQGINNNARRVIELTKRESADLILVLGDLAYEQDTPAKWMEQYDDILGPDFPVLAVVGNHEEDRWSIFKQILTQRLANTPEVNCQGDYGVKSTCRFRGITIVGTAPGITEVPGVNGSDNYGDYIRDELSIDSAPFSICAWHKNMRDMQLGGKSNATGWDVYEACREHGAMVVTGHEHSYARTHLMGSFENLVIRSVQNTMTLTSGATIGVVSGLGGVSARVQQRDGDWWASKYTADQGAKRGALFCDFGVSNDVNQASCYFKNIDDEIIDSFNLVSAVNDVDPVNDVERRVSSSTDDAEEQVSSGDMYIVSSDLELVEEVNASGDGRGPQQIGMRFTNMRIPQGAQITSAFLTLEADEPGSRTTNLQIRGEDSDSASTFTSDQFNISSRPRTSAVALWNNLPAVDYDDTLRSPDIKSVIQEIVNRPGWQSGGALALLITGSGKRTVESYNGESSAAPSLYVSFDSEPEVGPPAFSVADVQVDEADGVARVVVRADPAPAVDTQIWIAAGVGSATAGRDYYGAAKYLNFSAGTNQKSFDFVVVDDSLAEPDEAFVARIFKPTEGTVSRAIAQVVIKDDDQDTRAISITDIEADEDAGEAVITLDLSIASTSEVQIEIATSQETATEGVDYYGSYKKLTFAPGETTQSFVITLVDDLEIEPVPEMFKVRLFNPVGAQIGQRIAKVKIVDND